MHANNVSKRNNDKYQPLHNAIEEQKTEEDLAAADDNYGVVLRVKRKPEGVAAKKRIQRQVD